MMSRFTTAPYRPGEKAEVLVRTSLGYKPLSDYGPSGASSTRAVRELKREEAEARNEATQPERRRRNRIKAGATIVAVLALVLLAGCPGGGSTYRTCADARRASAAPLHRGDPGWNPKLDRDGDGTACEDGAS